MEIPVGNPQMKPPNPLSKTSAWPHQGMQPLHWASLHGHLELLRLLLELRASPAKDRKGKRPGFERRTVDRDFDGYPLVMADIAIENGHRNSEFSHEKW